jgi:DNA uptake protein ComE-like DNA-binding protein
MKTVRWVVLLLTVILAVPVSPAWQSAGSGTARVPAKSAQKQAATAPAAGAIDINRASKDELKTLPGIGDAYAAAIIRNRPYKNKAQLRSRNVIPDATYNKIKDKIIAKQ